MPQEGNASGLLLIVGSSFGDLDDWAAALFPLYVLSATCFFFFFSFPLHGRMDSLLSEMLVKYKSME